MKTTKKPTNCNRFVAQRIDADHLPVLVHVLPDTVNTHIEGQVDEPGLVHHIDHLKGETK